MSIIDEWLKFKIWAVVGVTEDKHKAGFMIYKLLLNEGYRVFCVNPSLRQSLGQSCYGSVTELPQVPDVADIVVPARVAVDVVRQCAAAGIKNVWLQPGADGPSVVEEAKKLGLNVVRGCVMAELHKRGAGLDE